MTPCYRVHLARVDGEAIDTPTGTLTYEHVFYRRNGKPHTLKAVARRFEETHGWRGYRVDHIEVFHFDPAA